MTSCAIMLWKTGDRGLALLEKLQEKEKLYPASFRCFEGIYCDPDYDRVCVCLFFY